MGKTGPAVGRQLVDRRIPAAAQSLAGLWDSFRVEVRNTLSALLAWPGDQAYRKQCRSKGRYKLAGPGPDRLRERVPEDIGFGKS